MRLRLRSTCFTPFAKIICDWCVVSSCPDCLADCRNQLVFVGELARLELGIELLAPHGQLEAASFGGNHDEAADAALVTR